MTSIKDSKRRETNAVNLFNN